MTHTGTKLVPVLDMKKECLRCRLRVEDSAPGAENVFQGTRDDTRRSIYCQVVAYPHPESFLRWENIQKSLWTNVSSTISVAGGKYANKHNLSYTPCLLSLNLFYCYLFNYYLLCWRTFKIATIQLVAGIAYNQSVAKIFVVLLLCYFKLVVDILGLEKRIPV